MNCRNIRKGVSKEIQQDSFDFRLSFAFLQMYPGRFPFYHDAGDGVEQFCLD